MSWRGGVTRGDTVAGVIASLRSNPNLGEEEIATLPLAMTGWRAEDRQTGWLKSLRRNRNFFIQPAFGKGAGVCQKHRC